MKIIPFLFAITLGFNKSNAAIQTWFSMLSQSGNNYKFQIMSWIDQGAGLNCPDLYSTPVQLSADTIYIRQLYDLTGVWQAFGCMATDTVDFVNIYPTANYINLSIGFYVENINTQNIDTLWNYHDTTYQVTSLSVNNNYQENNNLQIYPNPNDGKFTVSAFHADQPIDLSLYDAAGKLVYLIKNSKQTIQISIPALEKGCYFLKLVDVKNAAFRWEKMIIR
ncbi:MAG: T9SS type A sorting domain-containing protein [Chitinophagaceae bacterium]|nr:T9SS type A sorting domain-containing protein [Chitinophagaceae bacterium]